MLWATKLVFVLVTSASIVVIYKKIDLLLKPVLCIYYTMHFKKNHVKIWILITFKSKVNVITPVYASKIDFKMQVTKIKAQKIDDSIIKIFAIALARF